MAPSVPRTRAAAALRMKQIALDNQDRTIRRLRAQLATERRGLTATRKELKENARRIPLEDLIATALALTRSENLQAVRTPSNTTTETDA
ncbi:DNA helicase hus2 [Dorcoceras hygrometricum]|uniref:DNA helicase hus2 n=1 Tax=Dorcoceras hygrometricum TaxID=472368 RepID=A0A2Z7CU97_9LAMI|nr:DNA helicase hus2 [Dorcoceras hygrometricum]